MAAVERFQGGWNFLGLPNDWSQAERAQAWILPVGYEATTSYGAGTRNGPAAIVAASRQVELYDREFGCEPAAVLGIATLPPLALVHRSPEEMVANIAAAVEDLMARPHAPRLLGVLGGEHTISAGVVRAIARRVASEELVCVQIDAHADLRDEYEGSAYSHACAARRISESCPVFQIGIRNLSGEEDAYLRETKRVTTFFAEEYESADMLAALAKFVHGKQVYLTVDLDGLDPSIMPAVGTPEPGGLSWAETLQIVRTIARHAAGFAGFDVVELAPIPAMPAPDFLAARLVYKIVSHALLARV